MALMRLKMLSTSRHILPCFRPATSAAHVRWFANDTKNDPSKKLSAQNNTSVNKNILSARKKIKNIPEPALTIYPQEFALPKSKNKHGTAKPIAINSKNASKKIEKDPKETKIASDGPDEAKQQVSNKSNVKPQEILQSCTPDTSQKNVKPQEILRSCTPNTSQNNVKTASAPTSPPQSSSPSLVPPSSTPPLSSPAFSPPPPSSHLPPPSSGSNTNLWAALLAAIAGGGLLVYYLRSSDSDDKVKEVANVSAATVNVKIPATSAEIPKEVPYLLIGGGTASFAAFRAIKSHDPKAKVLVISNEIETPYMRPPLSKELWLSHESNGTNGNGTAKSSTSGKSGELKFKQWNGVERSLYYEPNDFYINPTKLVDEANGGVAIVRGYNVEKVDVSARTAILTDGTTIKYDECLLATGSSPKNLEVFERAPRKIQDKCSLFKTIEDYEKLKRVVDKSKSVAIIGGGFLGSELACALAKYGESRKLKVHQIFHEKGNMGKVLPEFLSEWTTERVREEGVNVIPNTQVESVELINGQLNLKLIDGKSVLCDHAVVAVGSEPNVKLAQESGLEVDSRFGGYLVNAELEARRHLYVAGDAACFYDPKLGRRRVEHHDHAVVSGRLAGENMVGLKKPYTHQSMFWSDLGPKVGYEAIGVIDATLPTVSVFAKRTPEETNVNKEASDASASAASEKKSPAAAKATTASPSDDEKEDFGKGVVFYLRDEKIIGIVLWNVFNRINTARAVIGEGRKFDDLNEVAKLFDIHT